MQAQCWLSDPLIDSIWLYPKITKKIIIDQKCSLNLSFTKQGISQEGRCVRETPGPHQEAAAVQALLSLHWLCVHPWAGRWDLRGWWDRSVLEKL